MVESDHQQCGQQRRRPTHTCRLKKRLNSFLNLQQGCCFQTACCPATGLLFPDCLLSLQQGCCFQTAPATGLLFPDCMLSLQQGCCFQTHAVPATGLQTACCPSNRAGLSLFPDCMLSQQGCNMRSQQQGCCFQTACCLLFPDCMQQQGCCQTACCPSNCCFQTAAVPAGLLFPDCLLSLQHTVLHLPQGRLCLGSCTCWRAEKVNADQTCYLTQ